MSTTKHTDAELAGYDGPFFPESLARLSEQYDRRVFNGNQLEAVGKQVRNFSYRDRIMTSDGYKWFWGLVFSRSGRSIVVLFPWTQDWNRTGGSKKDREIAVYSSSGNTNDVEAVVKDLWAVMQTDSTPGYTPPGREGRR